MAKGLDAKLNLALQDRLASGLELTPPLRSFLLLQRELVGDSKIIPNRDKGNLFAGGKTQSDKSMAFLEDNRNEFDEVSPAASLFQGDLLWNRFSPYPVHDAADQAKADELIARLQAYLFENYDPLQVDATGEIPAGFIDGLKALGVLKIKIPTEYGGLGLSIPNYVRISGAAASYCGSLAALMSAHQSIGVGQPVKLAGTAEQKARVFPLLGHGNLISFFALTDKGAGSDPSRMTSYAEPFTRPDGKTGYRIHGEKLWITDGLIGDIGVVMAKTPSVWVISDKKNGKVTLQDQSMISAGLRAEREKAGWQEKEQITAFIVRVRDDQGNEVPGYHVYKRLCFDGLRGLQNGYLLFDGLEVSEDDIIGGLGNGLKMALDTLNTGRLTIPGATTAASKQMLRASVEFARAREQMGKTVGQWQAGAEKLAEWAANTFGMDAMSRYTTLLGSEAEAHGRDIRVEAAMAKLYCSEMLVRNSDRAWRLWGGRYFQTPASKMEVGLGNVPVAQFYRDAPINCTFEGTSDIMHLLIARECSDFSLKPVMGLFEMLGGSFSLGRLITGVAGFATTMTKMLLGSFIGYHFSFARRQWFGSSVRSQHLNASNDHHLEFLQQYTFKLNLDFFALLNAHMLELDFGSVKKKGSKAILNHMKMLGEKQIQLGQLVDHATNLFAMATALAYADRLLGEEQFSAEEKQAIQDLADLMCSQHAAKIRKSTDVDAHTIKLIGRVRDHLMAGRVNFLYDGIMDVKFDMGTFESDVMAGLKQGH